MTGFCLDICEYQYKLVKVEYLGERDNRHRFRVSSLSRPGMNHIVHVQLSHKYNMMRKVTPKEMVYEGLVRIYSSDEWFKFGGCAYNCTVLNAALYPFFRAPKTRDHDYVMSHTGLAVLDLISRMGAGVLKENFSRVMVFNESEGRYE